MYNLKIILKTKWFFWHQFMYGGENSFSVNWQCVHQQSGLLLYQKFWNVSFITWESRNFICEAGLTK